MGELGSLLELLHIEPEFRTFSAEYRDVSWWGGDYRLVFQRNATGELRGGWRAGGPWAHSVVTTRKIWVEHPHRLRIELWAESELICLGVRDGARWWRWSRTENSGGEVSSDENGAALPGLLQPPVVNPATVAAPLRLELVGYGRRANRRVVLARGTPRAPLPYRAEIELEFDAEYGTVMGWKAFQDGKPMRMTEASRAAFGLAIEGRCFIFSPPVPPLREASSSFPQRPRLA